MADNSPPQKTQSAQRRDVRRRREALPPGDRISASRAIANYVTKMPIFMRSQNIACYLSIGCEVDTTPIILRAWRAKKRIFAPIARRGAPILFREIRPDSEFVNGSFGIPEPVDGPTLPARRFDLVITPVVAFDSANNRIGMGGGYYDRTFSFLKDRKIFLKPKLIGIAFDCQKIEEIAPNPWDIRVFRIITESS